MRREFDAARTVSGYGGGRRDDGRFGVEQFEDPLAGRHRRLQDVVLVAEVLDGTEEALRVLDEGDQHAEGDGAEDRVAKRSVGIACVAEDGVASEPDNEGDGGGAEEFDDGIVEGVGEDGVSPRLFVLSVDGGVVVEGAALAVEELHDRHPGDVLLREGVDAGGCMALAAVAVANVAAEDAGDVKDRRDDRDGKQR